MNNEVVSPPSLLGKPTYEGAKKALLETQFTLGDGTLTGAILAIVKDLNEDGRTVKGSLFHVTRIRLQDHMRELRVPENVLSNVLLVAQEVGVLRYYKGGANGFWEVCDSGFVEAFFTERVIESAVNKVVKRHCRHAQIRHLTANFQRTRAYADLLSARIAESKVDVSQLPTETETAGLSLENLAEAVAVAEDLAQQLAGAKATAESLGQRVTELEAELRDHQPSPKAVADELLARVRVLK